MSSDTEEYGLSRFTRGMTAIRPQRPLYGWEIRCSCGFVQRVNDRKPEATRRAKAHMREAHQA